MKIEPEKKDNSAVGFICGLMKLFYDILVSLFVLPLIIGMLIIVIPILLPLFVFKLLKDIWLGLQASQQWHPKGKRLLFVYSDSPNWKEYIETNILPKIEKKVVILNWSNHQQWNTESLEVQIFKHWANWINHPTISKRKPPWREFCPMAITFVPWWNPKCIRFWRAFKEYKHGKNQLLMEREQELLTILKIAHTTNEKNV